MNLQVGLCQICNSSLHLNGHSILETHRVCLLGPSRVLGGRFGVQGLGTKGGIEVGVVSPEGFLESMQERRNPNLSIRIGTSSFDPKHNILLLSMPSAGTRS